MNEAKALFVLSVLARGREEGEARKGRKKRLTRRMTTNEKASR
jgi:hypothetical protein